MTARTHSELRFGLFRKKCVREVIAALLGAVCASGATVFTNLQAESRAEAPQGAVTVHIQMCVGLTPAACPDKSIYVGETLAAAAKWGTKYCATATAPKILQEDAHYALIELDCSVTSGVAPETTPVR